MIISSGDLIAYTCAICWLHALHFFPRCPWGLSAYGQSHKMKAVLTFKAMLRLVHRLDILSLVTETDDSEDRHVSTISDQRGESAPIQHSRGLNSFMFVPLESIHDLEHVMNKTVDQMDFLIIGWPALWPVMVSEEGEVRDICLPSSKVVYKTLSSSPRVCKAMRGSQEDFFARQPCFHPSSLSLLSSPGGKRRWKEEWNNIKEEKEKAVCEITKNE